jgi:hypothetical protein
VLRHHKEFVAAVTQEDSGAARPQEDSGKKEWCSTQKSVVKIRGEIVSHNLRLLLWQVVVVASYSMVLCTCCIC